MTTTTPWPESKEQAQAMIDLYLDEARWQPVHRIHLENLMDWTEWDGWEIFLGVDWERDFGTIRSLAAKPEWHQVDRMRLHLLTYLAIKHDETRLEQEWLPYMDHDPRMKLYAQGVMIGKKIALARDSGAVMVYLCPTQERHLDMKATAWSDAIAVDYGFDSTSAWPSVGKARAFDALLRPLKYGMAYNIELIPEPRAEELVAEFLSHIRDVRSRHIGAPIEAHATFSHCVTVLGREVSGFITFWDED